MTKKAQTLGKILGVGLTSTTEEKVLSRVASSLKLKKKTLIVTPNPEIVLQAQNDLILKEILNKADISLPDGVGLIAWYKFLNLPNPEEPGIRLLTLLMQGLGVSFSILFNRKWLFEDIAPIKGRKVVSDIIKFAHIGKYKLFFLGGEVGEAKRAAEKIRSIYPNIKVDCSQGPMITTKALPKSQKDKEIEQEVIKRINKFCPDILFVGMTCPKQEKWLYRYLQKLNVTVGMTVGGTFRYLSGERATPPWFIDKFGLEWLFRLLTGSQNIERVGKAVWEFPARVFMEKLQKTDKQQVSYDC